MRNVDKMKYLFVVLCFALCECRMNYDCEYDSSSYPYWTEWTNGELISILDDSLAVVASYRYKKECLNHESLYDSDWHYWEDITRHRTGLFLVNYRTKKKPLLGDTLKSEYKILDYKNRGLKILNGHLFKDTSALVFDLANNKFGFWKIGEKSIKFRDHNKVYDLENASNAGHWINGSIIFSSGVTMKVLNTENGQIEQFDYSAQKYQCRLLSYIGNKSVCVDNSILIVDDIPVDTTQFLSNIPIGYNVMLGNYFFMHGKILKIDTLNLKFDKDFSLWIDKYPLNDIKPLKFYKDINNPEDFVSYSWQDLINFDGQQ